MAPHPPLITHGTTTPIPEKRYSKRDLCYLLVDPATDLNNPGEAKRISTLTLSRWIKRKKGLLDNLNITIEDLQKLKSFSVSQSKLIIEALG